MTPNAPEDDDGVLTPEELSRDDDDLRPIGDGRYVVETDGSTAARGDERVDDTPRGLADAPEAYATQVAFKTPDGVETHAVRSDDLSEAFEATMRWYARQLDPGADPDDVLRTLFAATELDP